MKILAIILLIYCSSISNSFSQEQLTTDSLTLVIENTKSKDTSLASAYLSLSEILYVSNFDTLKYLCEKTIIICETQLSKINKLDSKSKLSFQKSLAGAYNNIGYYYDVQGETKRALAFYHKSLEIESKSKNKIGIATSLNNIGAIYKSKGNITQSLDYFHRSLKIVEEIGDKSIISKTLNNIGFIYDNQGNSDKALDYFFKSLNLKKEIGNKDGIATSLNNIGCVYEVQDNIKKALEYYGKSLKIRKEIDDKLGEALTLSNIAFIYVKQHNSITALEYYYKSLNISKQIGDKEGEASSLNNIGGIELEQGKLKSANTKIELAFIIAKQLGYPDLISDVSSNYSKKAVLRNNYKTAYEMYYLHIKMRDSINNEETQKASAQQQAKYEYEKQKALDKLKSEKILTVREFENEKKVNIVKEEKEKQMVITFAIGSVLLLVIIFLIIIFNRLRITKRQKYIIVKQKRIVEKTHNEIKDSIIYAKRLQDAILPSFSEIDKYISDNFILFQPKDVVSGDFYWFEHKNNFSIIASADCTGHGVPGAMVSVVCSNALNRTVNEFGIIEPSKILDKTRELVVDTFAKSGEDVKDGMDIALCAFTKNKVIFSGANNPLWIIRNLEYLTTQQLESKSTIVVGDKALIEFKANKQPIGLYINMNPFTQIEIELLKGDVLYFFTDGFADQFGGKKGKKYKYKPFKKLLIENSDLHMNIQKEILTKTLKVWMGKNEQVDDICIIGVKPNI